MGSEKAGTLECTELCICPDGTPQCDFSYPNDIQKIIAAGSD